MGQKTSPFGFRLALTKKWKSLWYANKQEFGDQIGEDAFIRRYLLLKPICVGTSVIIIRRMSGRVEVVIRTARPGLVIGKRGAEIDLLKQELKKAIKKDVWIEVEEIKRPDLDAKLVADAIAKQLERRMPFRRVLKKAIVSCMDSGAVGVKVSVSGRLGGAEMARTERYQEGSVPAHTMKEDIDFGTAVARTTYGAIGAKVWINRGKEGA